ncbi:MAG TPA: GNAT family N-acetyltransferase [Pirellulales bacterium]|jgi:predicted N-acyltransferase|nr:GNAT family N-acetyltransferase [Pirellulales bacterium]
MSTSLLTIPAEPSAAREAYRLEIAEHVSELNAADWDSLRDVNCAGFMDRRFVGAVEASRPGGGKCWSLLVYAGARPVAAACLSLFPADAAIVAADWSKRLTERIRRVCPNYLRFNVLFCGLPVSANQGHLVFAADADRPQVVRLIDRQMRTLAKEHRAKILIFKEFDEKTFHDSAELSALGYLGVESTAVSTLDCNFANFDGWLAAMRSRYRKEIIRNQQKFQAAGFRIEVVEPGMAAERYTDEVHRLYEAVVNRSQMKLEVLPPEFFREIARRFSEEFLLMLAYDGERIIGFVSAILTPRSPSSLFLGVDYERNAEGFIYYNLFYAYLREILDAQTERIEFGANSEDFKARLGCRQRRNYMYVAATNWLRWPLRWFAKVLFPRVKLHEPKHIFNRAPAAAKHGTDA